MCFRKSATCQICSSSSVLTERGHSGKADAVIDLPKRHALGIVFDAVLGELRGTLVEATRDCDGLPSAAPWQTAQSAA